MELNDGWNTDFKHTPAELCAHLYDFTCFIIYILYIYINWECDLNAS